MITAGGYNGQQFGIINAGIPQYRGIPFNIVDKAKTELTQQWETSRDMYYNLDNALASIQTNDYDTDRAIKNQVIGMVDNAVGSFAREGKFLAIKDKIRMLANDVVKHQGLNKVIASKAARDKFVSDIDAMKGWSGEQKNTWVQMVENNRDHNVTYDSKTNTASGGYVGMKLPEFVNVQDKIKTLVDIASKFKPDKTGDIIRDKQGRALIQQYGQSIVAEVNGQMMSLSEYLLMGNYEQEKLDPKVVSDFIALSLQTDPDIKSMQDTLTTIDLFGKSVVRDINGSPIPEKNGKLKVRPLTKEDIRKYVQPQVGNVASTIQKIAGKDKVIDFRALGMSEKEVKNSKDLDLINSYNILKELGISSMSDLQNYMSAAQDDMINTVVGDSADSYTIMEAGKYFNLHNFINTQATMLGEGLGYDWITTKYDLKSSGAFGRAISAAQRKKQEKEEKEVEVTGATTTVQDYKLGQVNVQSAILMTKDKQAKLEEVTNQIAVETAKRKLVADNTPQANELDNSIASLKREKEKAEIELGITARNIIESVSTAMGVEGNNIANRFESIDGAPKGENRTIKDYYSILDNKPISYTEMPVNKHYGLSVFDIDNGIIFNDGYIDSIREVVKTIDQVPYIKVQNDGKNNGIQKLEHEKYGKRTGSISDIIGELMLTELSRGNTNLDSIVDKTLKGLNYNTDAISTNIKDGLKKSLLDKINLLASKHKTTVQSTAPFNKPVNVYTAKVEHKLFKDRVDSYLNDAFSGSVMASITNEDGSPVYDNGLLTLSNNSDLKEFISKSVKNGELNKYNSSIVYAPPGVYGNVPGDLLIKTMVQTADGEDTKSLVVRIPNKNIDRDLILNSIVASNVELQQGRDVADNTNAIELLSTILYSGDQVNLSTKGSAKVTSYSGVNPTMSDILNSAHNMNIGESIFFEVNNGTKLVQTPTGYQSTKVPLEIKRGDDGLYTLHLYTGEADSNNKDDVWTQRMANKPIDITDNEWAVLSGQMKFVSPTDAYMYSIKYSPMYQYILSGQSNLGGKSYVKVK